MSFGSPEPSARAEEGRERMRRISHGRLAAEKIEAVLESARPTIGVPCVTAEREYLMALGAELRHSREQKERVGLRLSALSTGGFQSFTPWGDDWSGDDRPAHRRGFGPTGVCE